MRNPNFIFKRALYEEKGTDKTLSTTPKRINFPSQHHYLIIQCYFCGNLLLAKDKQKTKKCTYCNTKLNLGKVRVLVKAESATDASKAVKALKYKYQY